MPPLASLPRSRCKFTPAKDSTKCPSTGQPWPEFKERFARLRESVTLIRALWTQERVSFEGQYYKTEKATI